MNWLLHFNPNVDFLSDIATFGGVIISLAIPISLNMVTRISERFKSEIISNKVIKHWDFYFLLILVLVNIIFSVCLRFLITSNINSLIWIILQWFLLFIFVLLISIFVKFFIRILKIISNPNYILNLLYEDAEKIFK